MSTSKKDKHESKKKPGTMAALLKDKPRRGRPPRAVSRQNVYVALHDAEKQTMKRLVSYLPDGLTRADLADLSVSILTARLEALRTAVAGRNREIPEGVTDLDSLYLLWDLPLPEKDVPEKWTSVRVSPQQVIELGRDHGTLNGAFGASRSQTFSLGLALLEQYLTNAALSGTEMTLAELRQAIMNN